MTGRADRRRPLVVAIVLMAAIGIALVAPVLIGARKGEPIPGSTVRADSHEMVAITTPLALFTSPSIVLEAGTVALVGPVSGDSHVSALIRTLMRGDGADLVLDRARLVVDRRGDAGPALAPAQGGAGVSEELRPVISSLSGFRFRSLTILDTVVAFETGQGPSEVVSVSEMEIKPGSDGLVAAKGRIEVRGEPLDIDVTFERQTESAMGAPLRVRATAKGDLLAASFEGVLTTGEHAQISAQNAELSISDLRRFAGWLGASWPGGSGLGPFKANGLLTLDERTVSFEHAEFALDGNPATGALAVRMGRERPSIEGTLAFSTFDIAPYATSFRRHALALASDWIVALRIPRFASPSFLRDMDADLRLSAASVTSGSSRLGRGAASLSIKNGVLYGELAELELEQGGRGEGQFTVDATGRDPRYTLLGNLQDIDLDTLVTPHLGPAAIDGAGDIRLDLAAAGATEDDIVKSLSGKLSLDMTDGGRVGLDLDALPAAAAAATPVAGWGAVGAGKTAVSELAARLSVARGVLTVDTLEATAGARTVTASGTVDIGGRALDLLLSVAPTSGGARALPAGSAPGDASDDASNAASGAYKLHGPWSDPTITRAGSGRAAGTSPPDGRDPG
ncbi:AsmA family protein [Hyphomicrobium sp.]|uniref:AsmA family protein n=1 Tax=Hyphomicrobium sp. TaxID=82 RepID=UPI002FE27E33